MQKKLIGMLIAHFINTLAVFGIDPPLDMRIYGTEVKEMLKELSEVCSSGR